MTGLAQGLMNCDSEGAPCTPRVVRVAVDIRILQGEDASRGIGHYTRGLVEALLRAHDALGLEVVLIVSDERPAPELDMAGAHEVVRIAAPRAARWFWQRPADAVALSDAVRRCGAQVLHVSSPLHGPFNWMPVRGVATIATLYDLIPLIDAPNFLEAWPRAAQRRYEMRMRDVQRLPALFAISRSVAADAAHRLNAPKQRVTVAYPALRAALGDEISAARERRDSFVLALGSASPSKNCETLLRGFSLLSAEVRRRHRLRLVGSDSAEWREWATPRLQTLGIASDVDLLSGVDDSALSALYRAARLFVLPSRHEGFGLPLLEAMTAGAPILASDIPVLREIAGDCGAFFDPNDAESLARALEAALSRSAEDIEQESERCRARAAEFSWDATARVVAEAYQEIILPRAAH